MKKQFLPIFIAFFIALLKIHAQTASVPQSVKLYSIVIKGGHLIDPKSNIDAIMDIAIQGGRIAKVAKTIDARQGTQVVNAAGLYISPGLIDLHVHAFWGTNHDQAYMNAPDGIPMDGFTFRTGVTTVVDAGSSGWRTFPLFKKQTIDLSQTRVLAFLNIVGEGMRGGKYEQDVTDMDAQKTAEIAKQYPDYIVGVKLAHFNGHDWTPTDRAIEAGKLANIPIMVDFGSASPSLSLEELFTKHFRPGDIYTHCFGGSITAGTPASPGGREAIVDANKKLKPFVLAAQKRGVVFDVGWGGTSFAFEQAVPALKSGFYPNSISSDQHPTVMNAAGKDMLNMMGAFMAMGMNFQAVIKASTWNPALEIKRPDLGNLSVGSVADIAILKMRTDKFAYFDKAGYKINYNKRLECEMTVRAGKIIYDLNAIVTPVETQNQRPAFDQPILPADQQSATGTAGAGGN